LGWGYKVELQNAYQEHRYESTSHQRETLTREGTSSRHDACREDALGRIKSEQVGCPFSQAHRPGGRCRGQIIEGFIVDFYCHKAELVVEVDGNIHDLQQEEDAKREKALSELGLRVIRFRNDEVARDLSGVVERIKQFIEG
jgi:hypothetical protein